MISKKKGARRQNSMAAGIAWVLLLLAIISTILPQEVASEEPPGEEPKPPEPGEPKPADPDDKPKEDGVHRPDVKKVKAFVEKYAQNGDTKKGGFEYFQLQQWYWRKGGKDPEVRYPRLFPFCLRADEIRVKANKNDHISMFQEILLDIEQDKGFSYFYNFDKKKHSTIDNKDWIESIDLTRINTPERDMVNLRQWMHVKIKTAKKVEGLLVQGIQGPLGMPFGDISLDFECKDAHEETKDIGSVGQTYPCSRRSRAHLSHPYVYVGFNSKKQDTWHMNFRWTDIACQETPYFQFLILVVNHFDHATGNLKFGDHFQALYSPVYENFKLDTLDGAPYPYHPSFSDNMHCFLKSEAELNALFPGKTANTGGDGDFKNLEIKPSDKLFRIHVDENYDFYSSVKFKKSQTEKILEQADGNHLLCPPPPLLCDDEASFAKYPEPKDLGELEKRREKFFELAINESKCLPCGPPECLESGFPEGHCQDVFFEFKAPALDKIDNISKVKKHGILALLGFLIFLPLANFVGRFYKEMWGDCLCGNGPWIHIHVAFHILATYFIYISLGPVVYILADREMALKNCLKEFPDASKDSKEIKNCLEDANDNLDGHALVGAASVFMHQLLLMFGVFRSSSNKLRLIQVILHSHFGYLAYLLAVISAILATYNNPCTETLVFCLLLLVIPILFNIVGVLLDILTDIKIGVKPGRKQWPILEPIKLQGRGPFHWPKVIVLIIFMVLMGLVWMLALISAIKLMDLGISDEKLEDQTSQDFLESWKPEGLFGQCDSLIKMPMMETSKQDMTTAKPSQNMTT